MACVYPHRTNLPANQFAFEDLIAITSEPAQTAVGRWYLSRHLMTLISWRQQQVLEGSQTVLEFSSLLLLDIHLLLRRLGAACPSFSRLSMLSGWYYCTQIERQSVHIHKGINTVNTNLFYFTYTLQFTSFFFNFKHVGLKIEEETSKMLYLKRRFIWCWNLDDSCNRSETSGKFWNVVLEKDGEDQLDRSCEKWRSIT